MFPRILRAIAALGYLLGGLSLLGSARAAAQATASLQAPAVSHAVTYQVFLARPVAQNATQNATQTATHPTADRVVPGHAIATRDLARGTVLSASDIQWVADTAGGKIVSATDHVAEDTSIVAAGWVTRRAIRTGETLAAPGVAHAAVIASGDEIDAVYQNDEVTLRLKGTAINGGAIGDRIYVKLDNRRRLRGVITGPHTVRVGQ